VAAIVVAFLEVDVDLVYLGEAAEVFVALDCGRQFAEGQVCH
jgi:hypothetical protein